MRVILIITLLLGFSHKLFCQDSIPPVHVSKGTASFYAKKFNGRKTSSGEKFSNDSLTGAHKKFKFGTYVLVRNLKNDSTVIVKINDRLPQKSKRSIDLTLRAAKQLNFVKSGLTKVEITVLDSLKN
ncbi:MAG: septal ring lytic transglycosylase RlpA family protein [Bacteroidetes bacterium]|nr:septal ring lytic transglycosylase RlpA family protein [Bacteroidota bacterium]